LGSEGAVEREAAYGRHRSIALYFGTKGKTDLDNFNKIGLDALTGIVWEDDRRADLRQGMATN
jgi:Holliday junction resolvase RusA-like endonuclease